MTQQYLRKVSLIVGPNSGDAIDLSALRIVFEIQRGDRETPNSAIIRVYNLADSTSKRIEKEFTRVVLQAGYEGNFGIIFDGTIKQIRRGRESPTDTHLTITAADGDSAYCFALVNQTLAAGATQRDIVNAAVKAMGPHGVTEGYIPNLQERQLPRGKVMFSPARAVLRTAARSTQTVWSIQNGKVQMVPETSYMPGDIPEINAATGMIGMPVQMQNGIQFRCLLNPSLKIGTLAHLNNASIQRYEHSLNTNQQAERAFIASNNKIDSDGYYYLMWVNHYGDTRGSDWYSEATCLAVDATTDKSITDRTRVPDGDVIKRFG